jgi:mannosyl-3-phosphoglycerate phosphatase
LSDIRPIWWHQSFARPAIGEARRLIVVTDIDASLLESPTVSRLDERAALDFLAARGIPLVINSSRTRAEIERLQQTLRMRSPFVSEHGSALFVPHGCFPTIPERARPAVGGHVVEFGKRYLEVVETLRQVCEELRVDIVSFSDLSIEEVARECGIAVVEAQLAKLREYTELFRIVDDNDTTRSRVYKALRRRHLRCWPTGHHHMVTAPPDRAEGLRTLKALWRHTWGPPLIVGFGDSDDDVAWLRHADVAVIVPDRLTGVPARALSKLPTAHVTRRPGRLGWSEAVFEFVGAFLDPDTPAVPRELLT